MNTFLKERYDDEASLLLREAPFEEEEDEEEEDEEDEEDDEDDEEAEGDGYSE